MAPVDIPLARCADETIRKLASAGAVALNNIDGATLLGERAMLAGMNIPARTSAGGGCRLFDALDDTVALNLSRPADRELLPALFATAAFEVRDDSIIAAKIARSHATALVERGRSMGLAIAAEHERMSVNADPCVDPCIELARGTAAPASRRRAPRIVDLSALWAGPLASHLLWLAGAEVIKVESRTRPDAMRDGDPAFYALLNQGKASVVIDFSDASDRQALRALLASADIVIEAARPRALAQLGIDAVDIVQRTPGLVWITITAHGAQGDAAHWVGFGDDCGVAGGLSAALRDASGRTGFVGDAIADPLTGLFAALNAWQAWASGRGGRFGLAMTHVVAHCLEHLRRRHAEELTNSLAAWSAAAGRPFPAVHHRQVGAVPSWGEHTHAYLAKVASC